MQFGSNFTAVKIYIILKIGWFGFCHLPDTRHALQQHNREERERDREREHHRSDISEIFKASWHCEYHQTAAF